MLEKIYGKILEAGKKLSARSPQQKPTVWGLSFLGAVVQIFQMLQIQFARFIFNGALNLARHYELGQSPKGLSFLLMPLADWLVLSKWRAVFGGQLKHLICGGAALSAEIANVFGAAGVTILQGYGLTQASAVVCCNRGQFNRAGTVGVPIAGTEVAIAEDGEVLVRGPSITSGYYKNPALSREMIDPAGWLHTGDLGKFTANGFLTITGLKKSLFKLSTGKYIAPEPIEQRLRQSPLVAQAIVVGAERKFCALLIVPNLAALHRDAQAIGIDLPGDAVLQHPYVTALYQSLVDAANCHLPYWGTVKRFKLLNVPFTLENGLLTSTHTLHRRNILQFFAPEIESLYREESPRKGKAAIALNPSNQDVSESFNSLVPAPACPTIAQSLNPRFTT